MRTVIPQHLSRLCIALAVLLSLRPACGTQMHAMPHSTNYAATAHRIQSFQDDGAASRTISGGSFSSSYPSGMYSSGTYPSGSSYTGGFSTGTGMKALTTIPMAARSINNGITADQALQRTMPRRTIINDDDDDSGYGDDDLRPDYDPDDPYFTPVGDIPWLPALALCLLYVALTALRQHRKSRHCA